MAEAVEVDSEAAVDSEVAAVESLSRNTFTSTSLHQNQRSSGHRDQSKSVKPRNTTKLSSSRSVIGTSPRICVSPQQPYFI